MFESFSDPTAGVHCWHAPGTCGELLQGCLDGRDFMVNCPIDLYATAQARASDTPGLTVHNALEYAKVKATLEAAVPLAIADDAPAGIAVRVASDIPRSKGMASSTADASAALAAFAACRQVQLDEAGVARLLTSVEPSDCTHYRGIAHLDFMNGELLDRLPPPVNLHVLALDCGGEVDTLAFDREHARSVYRRHADRLATALHVLKQGLRSGCNRAVAQAATLSTALSQRILRKRALPDLEAMAREWPVLGINCAHSGTVLGLLYEHSPGREALLRHRVARAFGADLPVIGAFRIIGGGNHAA